MDTPVAERALGFFAIDADEISAESRSRIEVFPGVGKYDHPTSGKFEIKDSDLDAWVTDINERGDKISIDYDHSFYHGKGSEAAGWFVPGSAALEEGKLYADVDWTDEAAESIKKKKYRFLSPEFGFKFRDAAGKLVNKPRLNAAALTNRPFFDEMQPVTVCDQGLGDILNPQARLLDASDVDLLDRVEDEATKSMFMSALQSVDPKVAIKTREYLATLPEPTKEDPVNKELNELLGLPEDASAEDVVAAARKLREDQDAITAKRAEIEAKLKSRKTTRKENDMDLSLIAEELGLASDADDASVIAALREARTAIEGANLDYDELQKLRSDAKDKAKLEERVKVIEAERRNDKIRRILEDGVRAGKVIPAEKPVLAKQFGSNPEGLVELLAARPDHMIRLSAIGRDTTGDTDASLYGVAEQFNTKEAEIDPESGKAHLRALHVLAEQGIHKPTEEQYFAALEVVHDTSFA